MKFFVRAMRDGWRLARLYSLYRDARISLVHESFGFEPYPAGRQGIVGLWRRPHVCADAAGAKKPSVAVVLSSDRRGTATVEAGQGCVPVRRSVMQTDAERSGPRE